MTVIYKSTGASQGRGQDRQLLWMLKAPASATRISNAALWEAPHMGYYNSLWDILCTVRI
jgi:hypothetical protein